MLRLSYDAGQVTRLRADLARLADGMRDRVIGRALAGLKRRIKTRATRAIVEKHPLQSQFVGRRLVARSERMAVEIVGGGTELNAGQYDGRWRKKSEGATWQYKRGGPRITIKSAFISPTSDNRRRIVRRARKKSGGGLYGRLPIAGMKAPSIGSTLLGVEVAVSAFAVEFLEKEIERLIKVELKEP